VTDQAATDDAPALCRRCGVLVAFVQESGTRAAALQARVDVEPYAGDPSRAPPDRTIWVRHPARGWTCLDTPQRGPLPLHLEHKCKPRPAPPAASPPPPDQGATGRPSMSIWDDPELRQSGNYVEFVNVGDSITGRIDAIRKQTFTDANGTKTVPQLLLTTDDGEEKTVTCGQIRLKTALTDERPEVGDRIRIVLTEIEKRGGGKTLKHFEVAVARGGGAPAAPAAPAAATADPPF
jgi:hypothetical protein